MGHLLLVSFLGRSLIAHVLHCQVRSFPLLLLTFSDARSELGLHLVDPRLPKELPLILLSDHAFLLDDAILVLVRFALELSPLVFYLGDAPVMLLELLLDLRRIGPGELREHLHVLHIFKG
jgi:hypothetical protein